MKTQCRTRRGPAFAYQEVRKTLAGLQGTSATLPSLPPGAHSLAAKRPRHPWLKLFALAVSLVVLLPVLSLAYVALSGTGEAQTLRTTF